jgi:hypothetical protein
MLMRKRLMEKVNDLGPTEHMEIYKIIEEQNVPTTENNNGVFFNLTTLSKDTYERIEEFVQYCFDNKKELDRYDQKLHECKYYNKLYTTPMLPNYGVNEPRSKADNLRDVIELMDDKKEALKDFVSKLNSSSDKPATKRVMSKFMLAKKRFMKKTVNEFNQDIGDDLMQDNA